MRPRKYNTETFINAVCEIHDNYYNYNETIFTGIRDKVKVICPVHGAFNIIAYNHLRNSGCRECSIDKLKVDRATFIDRAKMIYHEMYDYTEIEYTSYKDPITLICKKHGKFITTPEKHLLYSGCKKCSTTNRKYNVKPFSYFLEKANLKHNNKYTYVESSYIKLSSHVEIVCPFHGNFRQIAANHLLGNEGCTECLREDATGYGRTKYIKKCKGRNSHLYVIRCFNDTEDFYKIGIAINISRRFYKGRMPYNYEIVQDIESTPENVWNMECVLKNLLRKYKYIPKINFAGFTECYKI